ncbi:hypothetical protein CDO27_05680 [Sinorhizobium meliloti]|nr:hypothetical protein CDO27_05680 [Sinorhizobium meliloti]
MLPLVIGDQLARELFSLIGSGSIYRQSARLFRWTACFAERQLPMEQKNPLLTREIFGSPFPFDAT